MFAAKVSLANVDHLVVAPTDVWVIDSKAYRGRIKLLGDRLWYGKTCLDDEVVPTVGWTAERAAQSLGGILLASGLEVRPLLCIHGATLPCLPLRWRGVVMTTPLRCSDTWRPASLPSPSNSWPR